MHAVADTETLVADGVITPDQAREIEARARDTMVALAINAILTFGILAATLGFIFWLADALSVAMLGTVLLILGLGILAKGGETFRMFGNAAALIGAGMLIGGAAVELLDKYENAAGPVMTLGGLILVGVFAMAFLRWRGASHFVTGSILLMGFAFHIFGLGFWLAQNDQAGLVKSVFYLYAAAGLAGLGWLVDVRLVTALAIAPFAQMLDTGTAYFHAAYVFYSPEPTLSILQMALLIVVCMVLAAQVPERIARHARILAILGFIIANLCALVGSLWGDAIGETIWGPQIAEFSGQDRWSQFRDAREAFRATAIVISENVYTVLWAIALAAIIAWAAHRAHRGLFNTAMTFAAIHAYTQAFESFGDEPLAYVIGGLAAIPLAWAMWRLNQWLIAEGTA
ncbi:hypothetical protein [Marimonas lutisalis]|uniref:hypothetical protein n=1 Tax=Marimonas lutisalis TaxID=2545756 RepID=UPI0010F74559|nr:hypothetical protein [Marimonas lutisalis]